MAALDDHAGRDMDEPVTAENLAAVLPESIFRAYDIRGIYEEQLSTNSIQLIGQAVGSEALDQGIDNLLLAFDGRLSSPELSKALILGISSSGCNVVVLGLVPTPLLYFATHTTAFDSGVMLTASHNPANYNGLKIVFNKACLADNQIAAIRQRILDGRLLHGKGAISELDIRDSYVEKVCSGVNLARPLKVVVDCGNAVPAVIAPRLFEGLGCEVITLFGELDGHFPNHHPDPTLVSNLEQLAETVIAEKADLGVAFDGDGDRLGIVTEQGASVDADKLLMLLVQSMADRYPGEAVVFDVKCSASLPKLISELGMRPVMHRSGHSFMKQKMQETGAPVGGEFAAHVFIKDRWYGFDDGIYTAARIAEVLSQSDKSCSEIFSAFESTIGTAEIKLAVDEQEKFALMHRIEDLADFEDARLITLDGVRAEFADGWGLVRASNTSPALLLRFEAQSEKSLERIKNRFKALISKADNSLVLNF